MKRFKILCRLGAVYSIVMAGCGVAVFIGGSVNGLNRAMSVDRILSLVYPCIIFVLSLLQLLTVALLSLHTVNSVKKDRKSIALTIAVIILNCLLIVVALLLILLEFDFPRDILPICLYSIGLLPALVLIGISIWCLLYVSHSGAAQK